MPLESQSTPDEIEASQFMPKASERVIKNVNKSLLDANTPPVQKEAPAEDIPDEDDLRGKHRKDMLKDMVN